MSHYENSVDPDQMTESMALDQNLHFYAPAIFNGGTYSITPVRTYVRPICPSRLFVPYVTQMISERYFFKRIGVLD